MAKKFNDSKENPLHKEYGKLSNTIYILKKCKKYGAITLWLALLGIVCNSKLLSKLFWKARN